MIPEMILIVLLDIIAMINSTVNHDSRDDHNSPYRNHIN